MSCFLYLRPYNQYGENLLWVGISKFDNLALRDYTYCQFEGQELSFIFLAEFESIAIAFSVEANLKVYLQSIKMHFKKDLFLKKSYAFIIAYLNSPNFQFQFKAYSLIETAIFLVECHLIRAQKKNQTAKINYQKKKLLPESASILLAKKKDALENPILLAKKKELKKKYNARYRAKQKALKGIEPSL